MFKTVRAFGIALTSCVLLAIASTSVFAQQAGSYPSKMIRVVVPYPAGGSTDAVGRMVAEHLGKAWGQPVIVENRPGASGNIGADAVAKSPADGYTLMIGIPAMIQAPYLYANMRFDPFKSFVPVAQLAYSVNLLVVPASSPANSLKEFVALVKGNPQKFSYGSYGNGTSSHIHGELLKAQAGLDLVHVPYKGASPLATDLIGGQVSAGFLDVATARPYITSGRLKALAVAGSQRFKTFANVPTLAELGYHSFEPQGWFGVFAPAGTPKPIVDKLAAEVTRAVATPEFTNKLETLGVQPSGDSADAFARIMKRDGEVWGKSIRDLHIRLD